MVDNPTESTGDGPDLDTSEVWVPAHPKPTFRVHQTTANRKQIFAANLSQLLDVLGGNRKTASEQIQVSYRWMRRMVSTGISRPNKKNLDNLERVASYFALPNVWVLWERHLIAALIASEDGRKFVEKFGANISTVVQEQVEKSDSIDQTLVDAWTGTRSKEKQNHTTSHDVMLAELVATGRHDALKTLDDACKHLVREAYQREFGGDRTNDDRDRAKKSATA